MGFPEWGVWCKSTAFRHSGLKVEGCRWQVGPARHDTSNFQLSTCNPVSWSRSHSRPAPGFYPDTVRLQLPPAPPVFELQVESCWLSRRRVWTRTCNLQLSTFNSLRDGVAATRRSLKAKSAVRIRLPQPVFLERRTALSAEPILWTGGLGGPPLQSPGGEIASRLAYTQQSRERYLPGRPLSGCWFAG